MNTPEQKLKSLYTIEKIFLIAWIALIAVLVIAFNLQGFGFAIFLIALPVCFFIWVFLMRKRKAFSGDNITRDAVARSFELLEYTYKKHIDMTQLVEMPSSEWNAIGRGSDYFLARHRSVEFQFSNISLSDSDEDGSIPVFVGQWLILNLPRSNWPRMSIDQYSPIGDSRRFPTVDFFSENAAFNKQFRIMADDPPMVPFLVTPQLVENIMALDSATNNSAKGKKIFFIGGGHLHVILSTNRYFFEERNLSLLQNRIDNDIYCIKYIIDMLLSNQKFFS